MSLEHNLDELDAWLTARLAALTPSEQSKLLRKVGQDLRRENTRRMTAQTTPDGERWTPRKAQPRRKANDGKMMRKLRTGRHLRLRIIPGELRLGFTGRDARLARIHHYGLRDALQYGIAQYPARELIGISTQDEALIRNSILRHLENPA